MTVPPFTIVRTAISTSLPDFVRGMRLTWPIAAGTWRGDSSERIRARRSAIELVVEHVPVAQADEQHDHLVVADEPRHGDRVDNGRMAVDRAVDLGRADAHAARIQRRVGPAVDHETAVGRACRAVTLVPTAGEALVVRRPVAAAVGVVHEAEWLRRERPVDDELALLLDDRIPVVVDDIGGDTERRALDHAGTHRLGRVTGDETSAQIGTARDRGEVDVGGHRLVHPREPVGRQW